MFPRNHDTELQLSDALRMEHIVFVDTHSIFNTYLIVTRNPGSSSPVRGAQKTYSSSSSPLSTMNSATGGVKGSASDPVISTPSPFDDEAFEAVRLKSVASVAISSRSSSSSTFSKTSTPAGVVLFELEVLLAYGAMEGEVPLRDWLEGFEASARRLAIWLTRVVGIAEGAAGREWAVVRKRTAGIRSFMVVG